MKNNLKPVLVYIALVFILSIPFWMISAIYPIQILPGLPLSALEAFMPVLAALILTYKNHHWAGVFQLLSRSFDFKRIKKPIWYFIIVLLNPVIAVLAYSLMRMMGTPIPNEFNLSVSILLMFLLFFIPALAEEIGWSGFATEPLQNHFGTITTGILLGIVWAVWHVVPLFQASRPLAWILWWSLTTISLRMIMVWMYAHSGKSVFAIAVFHAMSNLSWQLFPVQGSFYDPQIFGLITFGIALLVFVLHRFWTQNTPAAARQNI